MVFLTLEQVNFAAETHYEVIHVFSICALKHWTKGVVNIFKV